MRSEGKLQLDFADEITSGSTITHGGKVVHEATAKALGIEPAAPPQQPAPSDKAGQGTDTPAAAGEKGAG